MLVMTALLLLGLMIMAAFTIDVGLWYSCANRLQRAADAVVLAGVTYMPNLTEAYAVAMDTAKKNGFDSSDLQLNVVPVSVAGAPRRLKVTLTDTNVPAIFGSMLMDHISITRSGTAEYVSQVPVGSPLNAIGTGDQPGYLPGGGSQNFYLAVGGYCTAKEDGDRFLGFWDGNRQQTPSATYAVRRPPIRTPRRWCRTSTTGLRATTTSSTSLVRHPRPDDPVCTGYDRCHRHRHSVVRPRVPAP